MRRWTCTVGAVGRTWAGSTSARLTSRKSTRKGPFFWRSRSCGSPEAIALYLGCKYVKTVRCDCCGSFLEAGSLLWLVGCASDDERRLERSTECGVWLVALIGWLFFGDMSWCCHRPPSLQRQR